MLINTIAILKEYVEVNNGLTWASFAPSIRQAEQQDLIPVIGKPLYQALDNAIAQTSLSPAQQKLLPLVQAVVAPYSLYRYIPRGEVQMSDGGIQRMETENNKTAYKSQVMNLRASLQEAGDEAMESLLDYLEGNKADFPEWENSLERKRFNRLLIRGGRDLKLYYSAIRQPQRMFRYVASMIETVEDLTMQSVFGAEYAVVKASSLAGTTSVAQDELIDLLKKAIINMAMSKALIELELRIDESGITLKGAHADSSQGDSSNQAAAEGARIETLSRQLHGIGLQYINTATAYLNANASASIFPSWYAKQQAAAASAPQPIDINPYLNGSFSL